MNYRADPDIRDILGGGEFVIPSDIGPEEGSRLRDFLTCDQVIERRRRGGERPTDDELMASARAAMAVYEHRTERLPVGWQKFAVLQAGLAGIDADSFEVQRWAYQLCKSNSGWLGDFDDDVDREMPLRDMTQQVSPFALIEESPAPAPPPKRGWFRR